MDTTANAMSPDKGSSMGFFSRLMAVYFEPGKAFADLSRNPRWVAMALLLAVLSFTLATALTFRIDYETYIRKMFEQSSWAKRMSEEQKQQAVAQSVSNPGRKYFGVVIAPVATIVIYIILAAVFLLVFILLGANLNLKQSLAATVWSMGPPGILLTILVLVFAFVKDPADLDLNPTNNIVTGLNILVSQKEHPMLHALLGSVDVFSFWTIFLLAVAFSKMTDGKVPTGKAAMGIVFLWALYVVGKLGFAALFS